ncbi:MAG: histidine kinase dimerization/phospho-acceptor domain-containing protein, partial [Spirochaetota bacterium]
ARRVDAASGFRITVVRADGAVVADSRADPSTMENHRTRPEILAAFEGKTGFARRRSATLGQELFYAARPLRSASDASVVAVFRIAADLPAMDAFARPARDGYVAIVVLLAVLASVAAGLFSRSLASPLDRLAELSRRVGIFEVTAAGPVEALGELRRMASGGGPDEIKLLADSLVSMASELDGRARAERLASHERSAILDGMSEAVFALDGQRRVRLANRSARELFGVDAATLAGLPHFLEIVRSVDLDEVASSCIQTATTMEREMALYFPGGERWFSVIATPLAGSGDASTPLRSGEGLVLVLNDVTKIRKLERVRKDFVANVSHELRTPVQLVKGFAETLLAGGSDAGEARRHLLIIERNAVRMENLIGDLLSLARLEQDGAAAIELAEVEIATIASESLDVVIHKAQVKNILITTDIAPGLVARVNEGLLVQALVNLLDNAVKYCPAGTGVRLEARMEGEAPSRLLVLSVIDRGPGIPARDQGRLFERFYTVDRARSRELGGTGL